MSNKPASTIKFNELVSKITDTGGVKDSILKTIIEWTKNNKNLQFIQKIKQKKER
tara:strand:- start:235 stop:399 length:165 start_codon:yes stop_codon:yes gene_type:complete